MIRSSVVEEKDAIRRLSIIVLLLIVVLSLPLSALALEAPNEGAAAKDSAEEVPKAVNPLGRLLEGILKKPQGRLIPKPAPAEKPQDEASSEAPEKPSASTRNMRDWIDRCAPHDYSLEKMLDKVERNLELRAWKIAVEQLQQILDQPNQRISIKPGESRLSRDEIQRIISEFPAEARESYELQFGANARQSFREATQSGRLSEIADVASRYLNTEAGREAADVMGDTHLDRGEWSAAAIWYQRILSVDPRPTRPPVWFLKAALAFQRAGLEERAKEMLVELKGLQSLPIAAQPTDPLEFWKQISVEEPTVTPTVSDWLQFRGDETRSAMSRGELPVLIPQWEIASVSATSVKEQIRELYTDLRRAGQTLLPVIQPVVANHRLLVRTMEGVAVVDLASDPQNNSDRPVWQTRQRNSPEQVVTGILNNQQSLLATPTAQRVSVIPKYQGATPETHPLTGLLFRNGMYGLISADEDRLYLPEEHAWLSQYHPGYFSTRSNIESRDPLKREWSTNRLVAYHLKTGRVAWEVGGESYGEQFELPLAGHYFFGAPLVSRDSLYVVGEKENEIRLFCLEAKTGHPRWSTLIGYSLHEPAIDLGRRWWTAQPAIRDGLLVVPNTTGWLLGVDLSSHSVVWETRFESPQTENQQRSSRGTQAQEGLVKRVEMNDQWHLSAPVILSDRVLHTPRESQKLLCLRTVDGKVLWQLEKGDLLALIHADERQILFATKYGLQCLDNKAAKVLWEHRVSDGLTLSGLPAVTKTDLYVPWSDGSLSQVSRADGKAVRQLTQHPDAPPLGNLRFYKNLLISADALRTVAFELESSFHQKLSARLEQNSEDAWSLMQKAQLEQLNNRPEETLALLAKIDIDSLSPHNRQRSQELRYESLVTLVRANLKTSEEYLKQLQQRELDPGQQRELGQLVLSRVVALGQYREAFNRYLDLADQADLESLVPELPGSQFRIRYLTQITRGLNEILRNSPAEIRAELNQQIQSMAEAVAPDDRLAVNRLLALFSDHPAIEKLRLQVGHDAAQKGRFSEAEYHFRQVLNSSLRAHAADAAFALDELYQSFGRHSAQRQHRLQLKELFERLASPEQLLEPEEVGDPQSSDSVVGNKPIDLSDWGEFSLNLNHRPLSYQIVNQYRYKMKSNPMPMLTDYRFEYNNSSSRLILHPTSNEGESWSVPMRSSDTISNRYRGSVNSLGHIMLVIQSRNITALSPVEKKVLWTRSLQSNLKITSNNSYSSYGSSIPAMVSGDQFQTRFNAVTRQKQDAIIALTDDLLCVRSTRELQAFHPLTGELLWVMDKISPDTEIVSNHRSVYLMGATDQKPSIQVRFSDGQATPLNSKQASLLRSSIALVGDDVIVMESRTFRTLFLQNRTVMTIRRVNLETAQTVWEIENNSDALMLANSDGINLLDRKEKTLSKLEYETGKIEQIASLREHIPGTLREAYVISSEGQLYLVLNSGSANGYYRNYYLSSVAVNGSVHAIDPHAKKVLWSQKVGPQHLLLDLIDDSPVLMFATRMNRQIGKIHRSEQSLLVLDKRSGREIISHKSPFNSDFRSVNLNHSDQQISLMSYNSRVVLSAVPPMNEPLQAPRAKSPVPEAPPAVSTLPDAITAP